VAVKEPANSMVRHILAESWANDLADGINVCIAGDMLATMLRYECASDCHQRGPRPMISDVLNCPEWDCISESKSNHSKRNCEEISLSHAIKRAHL